jgi:hypothetical protein
MSGAYKYRPQYTQNELGPDLDAPSRDSGKVGTPHVHTDQCYGKVPETEGNGEYLRCGLVAGMPAEDEVATLEEKE